MKSFSLWLAGEAMSGLCREFGISCKTGLLNPQSTMPIVDFVEKVYLPEYVSKRLGAATLEQYRDVWEDHLS